MSFLTPQKPLFTTLNNISDENILSQEVSISAVSMKIVFHSGGGHLTQQKKCVFLKNFQIWENFMKQRDSWKVVIQKRKVNQILVYDELTAKHFND